MGPFTTPRSIVSGLKDRVESIVAHGDRIYIGTATGSLLIYAIENESVSLVETKKAFSKRPIEQLGFIKDINSLVVLSDKIPTLYPLPELSPPTPLLKAREAFGFAIHSEVEHVQVQPRSPGTPEFDQAKTTKKTVPTLITQLVVGCRRRMVVYMWKDGEPQDVKEVATSHSARTMAFLNPRTVGLGGYGASDHAMFSIADMSVTEVVFPIPSSTSSTGAFTGAGIGMGALTGLTGYMTLGMGGKPKPGVVRVGEGEVIMTKDDEGYIMGIDGKPTRPSTIQWTAPPDETGCVKPYILSILPPGVTTSVGEPPMQSSIIHVRSSISLLPSQVIVLPTVVSGGFMPSNCTIRLLTPSPASKAPVYVLSTPTDRTAATAEGSSLWQISMKSWTTQLDELVAAGRYADALALLNTIDEAHLSDKELRRVQIRALNAVQDFREGRYEAAINTFIELDLNPAKVIALYPETISGRLYVPPEGWISLYGGPALDDSASTASNESREHQAEAGLNDSTANEEVAATITAAGSIRGKLKGLSAYIPMPLAGVAKDDDTASVIAKKNRKAQGDVNRSLDILQIYLADRRRKLDVALTALHITNDQSHKITNLSATSVEELFAIPNAPLSGLTPEQLLRSAQTVDTALFKVYLLAKPFLVGALCRRPNWCDVSEVEEELRAQEKHGDLVDLYHGKKMHAKALALLQERSVGEDDPRDKLGPSISYLQKLGPEYIGQIFESSTWIFEQDPTMAFNIFTSEDVELPRQEVIDYLEGMDPSICARFIEYLIEERGDESAHFHDRLAELYVTMILSATKKGDQVARKETYNKLLKFIDETNHYRVDRLYGRMSSEGKTPRKCTMVVVDRCLSVELFEARAILLGRLGRHDQALELYAYKLQDHLKAEEYCKRVYVPSTPTETVFLTLLRIYLRPSTKTSADLLQPALDLISRHSPRLDPVETLQLLPPLVTAQDLKTFLQEALRAPIFDTRVVREISKARDEQLARRLMSLQVKRVKVTDSRICPQCHKRLGSHSVIAVHAPHGEVTHYQCREAFAKKLKETRR